MKISIILLMYNSDLLQTLLTVKSIVLQEMEKFELIIADDGSEKKWIKEIVELCEKNEFYNYKFAESQTNVGTVKNILRALRLASGTYVKVIGAGDLFFSNKSISTMYNAMIKSKIKCAFCDFRGYAIKNSYITNRYYAGPFNKKPYLKYNIESIKKNMLVYSDYILGATLFFETEYLWRLLKKLEEKVLYAEDLTQVLTVLENEKILYVPQNCIIYEVGSGISTSKGHSSKMTRDAENFEKEILRDYKDKIIENRKRYEQKSKNVAQRVLISLLTNPFLYIKNFRRAHIRYSRKKNLGFLEDKIFIQEFKILRR